MSEYFVVEAGVRVVESKPTLVLDLVKYTTNAEEVRAVSIETEINDFHKLMLQDFSGWGATNDVYNAELRNKRKLRGYKEYGAPINTANCLNVAYSLDLDLPKVLGDAGQIKECAGVGQIREIRIAAFVDSKIEDPQGRGKFSTFMYQLTQLERAIGSSVKYPKWFTDKLNSEKADLEYAARRRKLEEAEAAAAKPKTPAAPAKVETPVKVEVSATTQVNKAESEFIERVCVITNILEGVLEAPHEIIVKSDGEVDVKLVYKHPRFEELKNGFKTELKYKWRVTEKVWRGTLKDIGKAVRPDFTLKMLLDFIHRNPKIKAQLEDEVKILLDVLGKGGLKYQQPK